MNLQNKNKLTNIEEKKKTPYGYQTSLVVQWLRICLPMQGTWV